MVPVARKESLDGRPGHALGGRWRGAAAALAAALLAGPFWSAGPAVAQTSPIQPGNQPTPIPQAVNGELPAADLINVAAGCRAARAAAPSLGLLLAQARDLDIPIGTEQCYRSLQDQMAQQQVWTTAGNSACAAPVVAAPGGGATGTSMHGWGKAADFSQPGGSVSFGSPEYAFLERHAGPVGWNHPGWAQPGGSPCPEAWHWEWVGDGGTMGATPIRADVVTLLGSGDRGGYASLSGLGAVTGRGDFVNRGSTASSPLAWLLVGGTATTDGAGYWMVGSDGGVFSFGDAHFYGSTGSLHLAQPIVGMAPTPTGHGYWLVAADGGIFSYGDAHFYGSTGSLHLAQPIVGMAPTPTGHGYWLVAADGGIFTYGANRFYGSLGATPPAVPVVSILATPTGNGYWIAAADGQVTAYGDAVPLGSA
jgi:D-alanyl-D-alanine carboxypeptidase